MRIASIHLPSFSLQAAFAAGPDPSALAAHPVAVIDAGAPVVIACSRAAWNLGVRPGMVAAVARGHAPDLVVWTRDPAHEQEMLRGLGDALLDVAPVVDLGGTPRGQHHAIYVEVPAGKRGTTFGGRLAQLCAARGLRVRVGIADDRFTASVAAASGDGDGAVTCVPRGGSAAFLAPHSLSLLALPPEVQHMLEALGVRTLGAFADLPPPSVARAWDADLQALARGDSGARLEPYTPGPRMSERVTVTTTVAAAIDRVAERVGQRLARRPAGPARLVVTATGAPPVEVEIDTAIAIDELAAIVAHALGSARPSALEATVTLGEVASTAAVPAPPVEPLVLTAIPSILGERPEHRRTRRGKQRPRIAPGQARLFANE